MPEGLSASKVGKEIGEHPKHADPHERRDRLISITEAVLLSVVALLAAWSGYAAAKWSTESRVELATASSLRIEASRADADAHELRNFDSSTFEAWFAAYAVGNKAAMRLAEHRFRPDFKVAFDASRATKPETNPEAPRGPTYMPQYKQPGAAKGRVLDARAKAAFLDGEKDGSTADKYVRLTVVLASILFLVGISTHFRYRGVRYGLVGLGIALLELRRRQRRRARARPRLGRDRRLHGAARRQHAHRPGRLEALPRSLRCLRGRRRLRQRPTLRALRRRGSARGQPAGRGTGARAGRRQRPAPAGDGAPLAGRLL